MNRISISARFLLVVGLAAGIPASSLFAKDTPPVAAQMSMAAQQFLASLSPEQKKKASFEFNDPHRTGWYFMPKQDKDGNYTRKGLPLEEMNDDQRKAALALLRSGTSASGFEQTQAIIGYESLLKEVEAKPVFARKPGWYFVSIFGTPGNTGKWGWRIEGHHMVASYTINNGEVLSPTPMFFGSNPGIIKDGPKKGQVILPGLQETAADLVKSFTDEQRKEAHSDMKQFPEIEENVGIVKLSEAKGIPAAKLTEAQQAILWKLMDVYINRMPTAVGDAERKAIKAAGFDKVSFAYTGEPLNGYTFQIVGPTFHARLLNVQPDGWGNPNNHIHSVWRRLPGDFGLEK
ncbi:DUF3500 domain-containing protein [Zavarzinella formosa]|uniref:DUF3500 domain-containing protein n=1 Tax=Zavarzinella formosa TaxID=360055 RepID=UPI0002F96E00|nr:DUF3500 domain-containing protein [Zavarzinella formosa]